MKKTQSTKKSEFISVRLSKEAKQTLQKMADKEDRTLSWLIAKIIDDHLKKK
ncbi:ribbon-helix-helix protein, CopG family [bacterium]|nr:ribbon-helix-helix protein, CopG family [bacterium]